MFASTEPRIISAPIDYWPLGHALRHKILDSIVGGTPFLLALQERRTAPLTSVMKFFSFLGSQEFYTVVILVLGLIVDLRFCLCFTVLLGFCFYTASFTKNLFCLPRPPTPPVIPVHRENADWAFPSNHGMVGFVMPFYIWIYSVTHYNMSDASVLISLAIVCIWSFNVVFSRLYLAVHSIADIIAGTLLGGILLIMYVRYGEQIVDLLTSRSWIFPFVVYMLLLLIHPKVFPETVSFVETVIVVACGFGLILGETWPPQDKPHSIALLTNIKASESSWQLLLLVGLVRVLYGGICVALFDKFAKNVLMTLIEAFCTVFWIPHYSFSMVCKLQPSFVVDKYYGKDFLLCDPSDTDCLVCKKNDPELYEKSRHLSNGIHLKKPAVDLTATNVNKKPYNMDVPCRFVLYTLICYVIFAIIPKSFRFLHLDL